MPDVLSQVLPVGAALAGVAITLVGNAFQERKKWRRARRDEDRSRIVTVFTDLLQTTVDITRALEEVNELSRFSFRYGTPEKHATQKAAKEERIDELQALLRELLAQTRRQITVGRLIGPKKTFDLIKTIEDKIEPVERLAAKLGPAEVSSSQGTDASEVARELKVLYDRLIDRVRMAVSDL